MGSQDYEVATCNVNLREDEDMVECERVRMFRVVGDLCAVHEPDNQSGDTRFKLIDDPM